MSKLLALWLLTSLVWHANAYVPARPVNDTSQLQLNSDDKIHLAWEGAGLSASVSRQLIADPNSTIISWTKYAKGVLVHFSEDQTSQPPSEVPWIALISCDTNGTNFSMVDDIFTLGRDRGAQAAVLYSLTSEGCLINQDYLQFEKPLDVYATRARQDARIIDSQYNTSYVDNSAYSFNSNTLNNSANAIDLLLSQNALYIVGDLVMSSIETSSSASPVSPSQRYVRRATTTKTSSHSQTPTPTPAKFLGAVLASSNMTVGQPPTTTGTITAAATTTTPASGGGNANTGLAMIILYAITGVVTFLFLCVILSGAIRAIRHPERYGPRSGQDGGVQNGGPGRSRAGGLTRAILDTFPVIQFGRTTSSAEEPKGVDVELGTVQSKGESEDGKTQRSALVDERRASGSSSSFVSATDVPASSHIPDSLPPLTTVTATSSNPNRTEPPPSDVNPADVDHGTTCPICVCEFEEGEDVRILPCDARHRFHPACIDPWLLSVSSLCPLCRLDLSGRDKERSQDVEREREEGEDEAAAEQQVLSNLRAMLRTGHGSHGSHARDSTAGTSGTGAGAASRFFRYVARRRQAVTQAGTEGTEPAASDHT